MRLLTYVDIRYTIVDDEEAYDSLVAGLIVEET